MTNITLYHNPRCSKSRQTLSLIVEQGIEPTIIEYLKSPYGEAQLKDLLRLLKLSPLQITRTKEKYFKEHNIDVAELSHDALIELLAKNPALVERPIVVNGDQAVIGRPPENVLGIL